MAYLYEATTKYYLTKIEKSVNSTIEVKEMQKFMTILEVAELTRYKKETIRLFVKLGQLRAYRRRAKQSELRFKLSDIETFMGGKGPVGRKRKVEKRK